MVPKVGYVLCTINHSIYALVISWRPTFNNIMISTMLYVDTATTKWNSSSSCICRKESSTNWSWNGACIYPLITLQSLWNDNIWYCVGFSHNEGYVIQDTTKFRQGNELKDTSITILCFSVLIIFSCCHDQRILNRQANTSINPIVQRFQRCVIYPAV